MTYLSQKQEIIFAVNIECRSLMGMHLMYQPNLFDLPKNVFMFTSTLYTFITNFGYWSIWSFKTQLQNVTSWKNTVYNV